MVTHAFIELVKQFFTKPATNLFPAPYAPDSIHRTLKKIESDPKKMIPPVEVPEGFRGKIQYDREACIGCQMCIKVCPSEAIEFIPGDRKVKFYMSRCTFCALCNDICPKKCIRMSQEFLMANMDKYGSDMIVVDSGRFVVKEAEKPKQAPSAPSKTQA